MAGLFQRRPVDETAVRIRGCQLLGLEESEGHRSGTGDEAHREVDGRVGKRLVTGEEPGFARLQLVARDQRLGDGLAQRRLAEVLVEHRLETGRLVLLVDQVVERDEAVPERARYACLLGCRAPTSSEALYCGSPGSAVEGFTSPRARMPPVDVPAIRSNRDAIRACVRFSISLRTVAGITPRIPPPSIESTFTKAAICGSFRSSTPS
jgi:hypothetical protein